MSAIMSRIERAEAVALPKETVTRLMKEQEELTRTHVEGKIPKEDYIQQFEILDRLIGGVRCESIMELKRAMQAWGMGPEIAEYWAAHENAHANTAQAMRRPIYYLLIFARDFVDGKEQITILPAVRVDFHIETGAKDWREFERQVTEAPDDLSEGDKEKLEWLNRKE